MLKWSTKLEMIARYFRAVHSNNTELLCIQQLFSILAANRNVAKVYKDKYNL